jgi:tRNA-splicing ligase RtcB
VVFGSEALVSEMDQKVWEQACNVAALPGIQRCMCDAGCALGIWLSRPAARTWHGRRLVDELAKRGLLIRWERMRSIAEEAPGAYKDVTAVVEAAAKAGLARLVARVEPMVCVKG